jgi:hypothetical protein
MEKHSPPRPWLLRPVMLLLAVVFLVEAWVWQACVAFGRQIIALIPWARLKALVAMGHPILGLLGWVAMQFAGVGLVAVAFDLTREKLLSMPWFVWVYEKFHAFHAYADALVAPYKAAALREMRALRDWARGYWARLKARES